MLAAYLYPISSEEPFAIYLVTCSNGNRSSYLTGNIKNHSQFKISNPGRTLPCPKTSVLSPTDGPSPPVPSIADILAGTQTLSISGFSSALAGPRV